MKAQNLFGFPRNPNSHLLFPRYSFFPFPTTQSGATRKSRLSQFRFSMVFIHDGQETQVLDDDSPIRDPEPPFDTQDKIFEELINEDTNNISFGETQALDDPPNWDDETELYGDTQALEDPVETQLYDQTQVLEDPVETQLYDQTQVLEDPVETQLYDQTQVLEDPVDTQRTEDMENLIETQVVEDTEDDEEQEERERKDFEERESLVDSDASTDDEDYSSIHKRLTSLRVASVRTSTRAANSNFKSKSNTFNLDKSMKRGPTSRHEQLNIKPRNDESESLPNRAVRCLFADVAPQEPVSNLFESQEPSILSQANALELVDKLISSNDVGPTQDHDNNNINNRNINHNNINIGAKIVQMAKNVWPGSPAHKAKIFDWDNMNEDEGGGEFFSKKKDLLCENSRGGKAKSIPVKCRERKKAKDLKLCRSDSRVILQRGERGCERLNRKKLFDVRENEKEVLERESRGVGPDTQMAVEAIQELVHGSSGGPSPFKRGERMEEITGEIFFENRRITRSSSSKIIMQEKMERTRTRSEKSVLNEGITVKIPKKRKEVTKEKDKTVFTPENPTQIANYKKKRTSYTLSPSNSENKKRRIFIRSATELLDKAKRQKRVYSTNTDEELILLNIEHNKIITNKIDTPSRVMNEKSPVFSPQKTLKRSLSSKPSACRQLLGLERTEKQVVQKWKDLRVRKDFTTVRVLLSNHLDDNIIKHQKKIMGKLKLLEASSISEATHFIANQFVRTRNMLEAIAMGKFVVIPLWLERCNLSNRYVDEKNFILRDSKKEQEFGFNLTRSLAFASNSPLLKGRKVVITQNVKPSQQVVTSLVLACGGQPMERIGRSLTKEEKFSEDILVISCEEDYATCVPLLVRGAEIFGSELILNGIIVQKLEFERHRLFGDHVKRTRSTIWLRDEQDGKFVPVTKCT